MVRVYAYEYKGSAADAAHSAKRAEDLGMAAAELWKDILCMAKHTLREIRNAIANSRNSVDTR